MNEEQQKENWARLDKEIREAARKEYFQGNIAITAAMQRVFGLNPGYNTEPSELLFVEREKVQDLYSAYQRARKTESTLDKAVFDGRMDMLDDLFGDKCLPDKEPSDLSTQDKETMEEKELNLCELLRDCKGEIFYTPICGECEYNGTAYEEDDYPLQFIATNKERGFGKAVVYFDTNGLNRDNGIPLIFPSRALYEKYPLDGYAAWMEWQEEREPKYILQTEIRLISKDEKTIEDYENVEMEVSNVDLSKAAEAVRKTLEEFHAKNTEK